jgi:hypothetical protein
MGPYQAFRDTNEETLMLGWLISFTPVVCSQRDEVLGMEKRSAMKDLRFGTTAALPMHEDI